MKKIINFLPNIEKQNKVLWCFGGFLFIGIVSVIDFLTWHKISFSLFYLVPISLVTWFTSRRLGITMCIASSFAELIVDISTNYAEPNLFLYYWDTFVEFIFSFIIVLLLSELRESLQYERKLAHTDFLTGAVNTRSFLNLLQLEMHRFERSKEPFTLVYIDLDNFKTVNNKFGHDTGNQVLSGVVNHIKKHLRKMDIVARLGGDEFALLLPQTDEKTARLIISRIQEGLLKNMEQNNWPVTFSIGVLVCYNIADTMNEMIKMADDLMYSVKRTTKNSIKIFTYTKQTSEN